MYDKCKTFGQYIAQKVTQLKDRISDEVKSKIAIEIDKTVIIHPVQTFRYNAEDMFLGKMNSKTLYKILIAPKLRVPKGLLNWCLELELTDQQIKTALTFAHQCSINTFLTGSFSLKLQPTHSQQMSTWLDTELKTLIYVTSVIRNLTQLFIDCISVNLLSVN